MNLATASASAALAAVTTLLNGGTLVFYSGTQPITPETALSGNTALVTFTFAATAFGAPSFSSPNEQATATFSASSVSPTAQGTATFARGLASNGTTVVADFTVGTTGTDIIIGNTGVQTGVPVTISSFILKVPAV